MDIAAAIAFAEHHRSQLIDQHESELVTVDKFIDQLRARQPQKLNLAESTKLYSKAWTKKARKPVKISSQPKRGRPAKPKQPKPEPHRIDPEPVHVQLPEKKEPAQAKRADYCPRQGGKLAAPMREVIATMDNGFSRLDLTTKLYEKHPDLSGRTDAVCVILLDMLQRGELTREGQGSMARYSKLKLRAQ